ncbi:MAG: hypothetical protein AAF702_14885 [Chloroflexota bacterium]
MRLQDLIKERTQMFPEWISSNDSPYFGTFEGNTFEAYKLSYRDSFNPMIDGKIQGGDGGIEIHLHMSIAPAVKALLNFMYFTVLFVVAGALLNTYYDGPYIVTLGMILFPVLIYGFCRIGIRSFLSDAEKRYQEISAVVT